MRAKSQNLKSRGKITIGSRVGAETINSLHYIIVIDTFST
jgi:hypothetical protein